MNPRAKKGKIIAVVGSARSGKSFLARKLGEHYGAEVFVEGGDREYYPARIKEDISKDMRPLERAIWFHNHLAEQYIQALLRRERGETVVLDMFWLGARFFAEVSAKDPFEREILRDLFSVDEKMLGMPDLSICLSATKEKMKEFIKKGGRDFDQAEAYFENQIWPVAEMWDKYCIENKRELGGRLLHLDRSGLDFERKKDFEALVSEIDRRFSGESGQR